MTITTTVNLYLFNAQAIPISIRQTSKQLPNLTNLSYNRNFIEGADSQLDLGCSILPPHMWTSSSMHNDISDQTYRSQIVVHRSTLSHLPLVPYFAPGVNDAYRSTLHSSQDYTSCYSGSSIQPRVLSPAQENPPLRVLAFHQGIELSFRPENSGIKASCHLPSHAYNYTGHQLAKHSEPTSGEDIHHR